MGVQINGSEGNVIATKGTFSGDVGIGGTLTYEDVTNIDSVGLITARSGIKVTSGDIAMDTAGNITLGDSGGATDDRIAVGAGGDIHIYHDGTDSYVSNATGDLKLFSVGGSADDVIIRAQDDIELQPNNGEAGIKVIGDGAVELYHDNSKRLETTSAGVKLLGSGTDAIEMTGDVWFNNNEHAGADIYFNSGDKRLIYEDNVKAVFGGGGDLQIVHNGSDSQITDSGTGSLALGGSAVFIQNAAHNANMASFVAGAEANLFYNGTKTFETENGGVKVTGNLTFASNGNALNFQNQTIESTSNYNRTVTAEKIDYYEEGYLDPTAISAGLTWDTSSNRQLRYVRIGNWVSVSGLLLVSSRTSNSNTIKVAMPFTSASQTSEGYYTRGVGAVMYQYVTLSTNMDDVVAYVGGNENYMRFFQTRTDGGGWTELVNSNLGGNNSTQLYFSINYMVA